TYKKLVFNLDGTRLMGGILVGDASDFVRLSQLARSGQPLPGPVSELFVEESARDALLESGGAADLNALPDDTQICNCHQVTKGSIVQTIREGKCNATLLGECTRAGTGCGTCKPLLTQLIGAYGPNAGVAPSKNPIELLKEEKD